MTDDLLDRKVTALHRRLDEINERGIRHDIHLEDMAKRFNEHDDDDDKRFSRIEKALGMTAGKASLLVGILLAAATLLVFSFFTKADGQQLEERLSNHTNEQNKVNNRVVDRLDQQQKVMQDVSVNVEKIGERLRVQGLRRSEERE